MAGAIDLFTGTPSIQGANLWQTDKDPLNQLDMGIESVIGKQANLTGSSIITGLQNIIDAILGIAPGGDPLNIGSTLAHTIPELLTYFGNIEAFLGDLNPLSPTFDPAMAIVDFWNLVAGPSNLFAGLVPNASGSAGLTGFIPMENLAMDLIAGVVGGAQNVIDAILSSVGVPAGSGTTAMVDQMFTNLMGMLANPSLLSSLFNPAQAIQTLITDIINPLNLLAPMDPLTQLLSPLNIPGLDASKITSGQFPQDMIENLVTDLENVSGQLLAPIEGWLTPLIPASAVSNINPNLLANPTYNSSTSVNDASGHWIYDGTVSHTADGSGSVKVVADGTSKQLLSDPPIPVAASQQLSFSHYLEWSGVVGSGKCFTMSVVAYLGAGAVSTTELGSVTNPSASSAWTQLTGSYTVPASGVDHVRMQLAVLPAATAGTVHWDDGDVHASNLMSQNLVTGLVGDISNLWTGVNASALQTDVMSLVNALGSGSFSSVGSSISAITARLFNLNTTGQFNAASLFNIANIPQLLAASVGGIAGIPNIGSALQQTWDSIMNVGSGAGSLTGIVNKLFNLSSGGLFNAGFLTNMLSIPTVPAGSIPGLDATKIISGVLSIVQVPTGSLNRGNISDLGGVVDGITGTLIGQGGAFPGSTVPQANGSMGSLYSSVLNNTTKMQALLTNTVAQSVSGVSVQVAFNAYPDGAMPSIFTVTYLGPGTSQVGIKGGVATWNPLNNDGSRTGITVYNVAPTNTDYQLIRGSMANAPSGNPGGSGSRIPRMWVLGRVDNPANPQNYVWARAYCTGFLTYKGDIGCMVGGVETVFASNISLTWSMDIQFVVGVNGNPRRYQVFSGTQLVYDYTESGTTSQLGAGFRYWGARNEMSSGNSTATPGDVASTSVTDNATPVSVGSVFRTQRLSTTNASMPSGTNYVPNSYFDTIDRNTPDYLWDSVNGILTFQTEGTYAIEYGLGIASIGNGTKLTLIVWRSVGGGAFTAVRALGPTFCDSYLANSANQAQGSCQVYCKNGDQIRVGYYYSGGSAWTSPGDAAGIYSYLGVALANRSMA